MYQPNSNSKEDFIVLQKNEIWEKVQSLLKKYKKMWAGPDIPIYIFPISRRGNLFFNSNKTKSGVTFPDKIFLFLSDIEDEQEIEALFIHEYHHLCRMNGIKKPIEEYTLLDSLIMEGLAEDAVHEILGINYVAPWNKNLNKETFQYYWKKYLQSNLSLKKGDRKHELLLFGKGMLPNMLGYTCGYHLVRNYREKKSYSTKESFIFLSENFVNSDICQA
jgi:uncharacterized protein YjaZ